MVYTIYGDLLFFTDFLMDLTLLWAVCRFGCFKTRPVFLILSAFLGGIFSFVSVLPQGLILRSWYGKTLVSLAMTAVAFPKLRLGQFFLAVVYFYMIGFVMAGAVLCLSWFFREQGWYESSFTYTAMGLSAALIVALALSRGGRFYLRKTIRVNDATETVIVVINNKKKELTALFDTGNELTDPLSGFPVAVVEFDAVASLLPREIQDIFYASPNADQAFSALSRTSVASRLRLIPFNSLGESNGMMLGFRPDKLCFPQRKKKESKDIIICFYPGSMETRRHCRCIINPAVLDKI